MKIAVVQAAPVFLNPQKTAEKLLSLMREAGKNGAQTCVFPEVFLSGYPLWLKAPAVATNDALLKKGHVAYLKAALCVDDPLIKKICEQARALELFTYVGFVEKNRSGGSVYASTAAIHPQKGVINVHRKMKPTFQERLIWSDGDGHGLKVQDWLGFKIGALNCYENWQPLARQALYEQGEQLHIATWPGDLDVTDNISQFIAMEGRLYVASASGLLRVDDIPENFVLKREVCEGRDLIMDGGSMIVAPGGEVIAGPVIGEETILYATLDQDRVFESHMKLDPAGHYGRPDILQLAINHKRFDHS